MRARVAGTATPSFRRKVNGLQPLSFSRIAPLNLHSMRQSEKLELVYVIWIDPHSIDPWTNIKELDGSIEECESIGWVVQESKKHISVSGVLGFTDECCCTMNIPKKCIISIKYLGRIHAKDKSTSKK
jgi:hypothetical protein